MRRTVKIIVVIVVAMGLFAPAMNAQTSAKREFRGAWMQFVNGMYLGKSMQEIKDMLAFQLDELEKDGVNAIFFQVRGECDALYPSKIEPWSRYLSGIQGQPPSPYWDPMQWMIDQCHRHGMEFHAWINPYRARMKTPTRLAANHIMATHPERVFEYGGLYVLNPGLKENRDYILTVVDDIVSRYDVDGVHIDDYFYPYPEAGKQIPDDREYQLYNNGIANKDDWRRDNVNVFVKEMGEHIHRLKPWVKFGVSPFGIYRNKANSAIGSDTNGLQNYDQLYADVLLWVNNGWVDYCVPQLYWQIGHKAADYETLIRWWNGHMGNRPLYIGESIENTVKFADTSNPNSNQMPAKFRLHQQLPNVCGTVLWYAKVAAEDMGSYGTMLRNVYWKHPALPPFMTFLDAKSPKKPRSVAVTWAADDYLLYWSEPKAKKWGDVANRYVVYRFAKGEKINLSDASKIQKITYDTFYKLPYADGKTAYTYVVTALDRVGNESAGVKKKVKL